MLEVGDDWLAIKQCRHHRQPIFHCKTEGYNPNQDALHQLARHQQTKACFLVVLEVGDDWLAIKQCRHHRQPIFHCKTEGYNPNQDALHQLARHQQTIIFRLRTGHCKLNSHLKRIGVKTSAQCPCGEADQTPEHYLQSCSLHQQARQQIWPTCVSLKTKLWGSAEDLFLTSRYAALTGERI